jgi:protein-tyrosine phosphatase
VRITIQVKPYELLPRLWIGGAPVADPAGMHVDLLVMLAHEYDPAMARGVGGLVRYLPLRDDGVLPPTDEQCRAIRDVVRLVAGCLRVGDVAALTCVAGQNRSALVGALVMIDAGYSAEDALHLTTRARPGGALTNPGFRETILSWPHRLSLWED